MLVLENMVQNLRDRNADVVKAAQTALALVWHRYHSQVPTALKKLKLDSLRELRENMPQVKKVGLPSCTLVFHNSLCSHFCFDDCGDMINLCFLHVYNILSNLLSNLRSCLLSVCSRNTFERRVAVRVCGVERV